MTSDFENLENEGKQEEHTISEFQKIIKEEDQMFQELKKELIDELKEIKHLYRNMTLIENQMQFLRPRTEKRKILIKQILFEAHKQNENMNVKLVEEIIKKITLLDAQINERMNLISKELQKLQQNEFNKVKGKNEEEMKSINMIDEKAKMMNSEIIMLNREFRVYDQDLLTIKQRIEQIKASQPRNKVGFGN